MEEDIEIQHHHQSSPVQVPELIREENESEEQMDLPPHAAFLYQLLGPEEAEGFLNPSIEDYEMKNSAQKTARLLPRRKNGLSREMSNLSQHATSAERLWRVLREDSMAEMERIETRSYITLRDSYDSFVRQCILKREIPALLKDLKSEEWHAFRRLLEKSKIDEINEQRRKNELMFRMARANENKHQIIVYNNPLPDLVNRQGTESITRYLPINCFPVHHIKESHPTHRNPLDPIYEEIHNREKRPESQKTTAIIQRLGLSDSIRHSLERKHELPMHLKQSYRFLRESDCQSRGQFRDQMAKQMPTNNPLDKFMKESQANQRDHLNKTSAAFNSQRSMNSNNNNKYGSTETTTARTRTASPSNSSRGLGMPKFFENKSTPWAPLSLASLLDYSRTTSFRFARKTGEFREGRQPVWRQFESLNID